MTPVPRCALALLAAATLAGLGACGTPETATPDAGPFAQNAGTQGAFDAGSGGGSDAGKPFLATCPGPTGGSFSAFCSYTWLCTGGDRTLACTRRDGGEDCSCSVSNDAGPTFPAPSPATFCSRSSDSDFKARVSQACGW